MIPDFSNNDCCASFAFDTFVNVCLLPRSIVCVAHNACACGCSPDDDTTSSVDDCAR